MKLSRKMKKQLKTKIISTTLAVGTVVVLLFACSKIDIVMDKIVPIILQRDTKIALLQNTIEEEGTSDGINLKITGVSDNGVKTIQVYQESTKVADYTYSGNTTEKQEDVKVSIPFGETANIIVKVNGSVVAQKQVTNMRYISTAQDLCNFRDIVNAGNNFTGKYIELTNDIDLSSVCSSTLGSWTPIEKFDGIFNGNYYRIKNLYISSAETKNLGLFLYNSGNIENLMLENLQIISKLQNSANVSIFIGGISANNTGNIINCGISNGKIEHTNYNSSIYAGGIVGTGSGNIYNSFNNASIYLKSEKSGIVVAGGVLGYTNSFGEISNCYNTGDITAIGYYRCGGIAGVTNYHTSEKQGTVKNCFNIGKITASGSGETRVAGVIGQSRIYFSI